MTLWKHEINMNLKSLLIWSCCIGIVNCGCLLLFESLADAMGQMAESYSQMGSFSTALGLDRLSIAAMEGFYATELGLIFAIGGAMFAAMTGAAMLSKEEEGHTSEFLHTLPFGRGYIIRWKYLAMVSVIILFQVICIVWEILGFMMAGEMVEVKEYLLFHGAQFLMQLEMGSICFLISSGSRKKQTGTALGLAVLLYVADMMCRIVPDIEKLKYVTPYYFSNAADIFASGGINGGMAGISISVTIVAVLCAAGIYVKKDIAA